MSGAAALAFAAAVAGVLAAWDLLAAAERLGLARRARHAVVQTVRAGSDGRPASAPERRRLALLATGALAAAGWLAAGPWLAIAAAVAGPSAAGAALRMRRARHAAALGRVAAQVARSVGAGMAAGRSVRSALAEAGEGLDGAARAELQRAGRALALGEPTEAVLERLRRRARHPGWDTMVAAILLQRDCGGDLAALLRHLAASLEEAARRERDARAATAQSRFTAWLVFGMPLVAAAVAELADPGFLAGLLGHPLSALLVALAVGLQVLAAACVRRLARSPA